METNWTTSPELTMINLWDGIELHDLGHPRGGRNESILLSLLYHHVLNAHLVTSCSAGVRGRCITHAVEYVLDHVVEEVQRLQEIKNDTVKPVYKDHLSTKATFVVSLENGFSLNHVLKEPTYKDHLSTKTTFLVSLETYTKGTCLQRPLFVFPLGGRYRQVWPYNGGSWMGECDLHLHMGFWDIFSMIWRSWLM